MGFNNGGAPQASGSSTAATGMIQPQQVSIDTQGLPIFIGNSRGVTVADNVIIRPFQATPEKLRFLDLTRPGVIEQKFAPPVPAELLPVLREPFYGIFISASDEVTLTGNRVEEAPPFFKGLHVAGPWNGKIHVP